MSTNAIEALFSTKAHNPVFSSVRAIAPISNTPVDFCVPVNRHFPPPSLMEDIQAALPDIVKYYPDYANEHQQALSELSGVPSQNIVVANGSTELITLICRQAGAPMATSIPTFGQWTDLPTRFRIPVHFIKRQRENEFALSVTDIVGHVKRHRIRTLVLSNPNNPTGAAMSERQVETLLQELSDLDTIVIDESFIDFSSITSASCLVDKARNLIVVKSLGKSLGWHGLRLGYAVTHAERAESLRNLIPCWNINGLAAFVLKRVAGMRTELQNSLLQARSDRQQFQHALNDIDGLRVFPSHANFVYVELPSSISGRQLRDTLLERHGLFIRECSNKLGSTEQYLRLAVNRPAENERLVSALKHLLAN